MSANPEAFEYLRRSAYNFLQKNRKDRQKLFTHCTEVMKKWLNGDGSNIGLTDIEAKQLVAAVTDWTILNYNPPQRKADRHREERAAAEIGAPLLLEFASELYGAATIRNAARIGGQSKSTVARHLLYQGISPVRQRKIDELPARIRWLVSILDETFPRDGAALVLVDDLVGAVWDKEGRPASIISRSTQSTRRKKLKEYVSVINAAGIGFHLLISRDVIAIRRGRRFKSFKEVSVWIEEERRFKGMRSVKRPNRNPALKLFWDDPWLNDVLATLQIGLGPYFTDPSQLEPLLRLTRPLLDPRPLYHLFQLVIEGGFQGDFSDDLAALAKGVKDPVIRKAAYSVAIDISRLGELRDRDQYPDDYFDLADRHLQFMERIKNVAPESYAALHYFRSNILVELSEQYAEDFYPMQSVLNGCVKLKALEKLGDWKAPSTVELANYQSPKTS